MIHGINALIWHEKLLFQPFSLESKFICPMRKTWILMIIFILFMIRCHKHVLLIGIHDIDSLFWQEKLFFPLFSWKPKFIRRISQSWIIFVIGYCKHALIFRIHDIEALFWQGILFFPSFSLESKFIRQMRETWIL